MTKEQIEDIIQEYIENNLRVEIDREFGYYPGDQNLVVTVNLKDTLISVNSINIG